MSNSGCKIRREMNSWGCDKRLTRSKNRERPWMTQIHQRGLKLITEFPLVKRDNLFICKEGENDKTSLYSVEGFFILFIISGNPWDIQSMKVWPWLPNDVPNCRWDLGAATILDYCISVGILDISDYTWKNLLQGEPRKYGDIITAQYI